MKRETRANLIFISVFLCLTIPGAVILFKKKLDPAAPPMFMPDFVRRRLPYMASQLSPEQVTRYVPDLTGQWVSELTRQRAGTSAVLMSGREPLVSDDHLIQLTAMQHHGAMTTLHFILIIRMPTPRLTRPRPATSTASSASTRSGVHTEALAAIRIDRDPIRHAVHDRRRVVDQP